MGMVITLFLALATMTVCPTPARPGRRRAGLVFFAILLIGASIRVLRPVLLALGPRRDHLQVLGLEHQGAVAGRVVLSR